MQGQLVEHRQQRQLFVVAQTAQQLIDPRLVAGGNLLRQRLAAFGQPQDVPAPVAAALDLFQQPVRFKGLTVRSLLEIAAGRTMSQNELCKLLGKVGLCAEEYINREMNTSLSGGESKRIEIATVLARNAEISVFDEPEAGIDLWSFARLVETFEEIRESRKGTLVVISHQERIISIADDIVVIAGGAVRASGTREKVLPTLLSDEKTARCPINSREAEY